jgi:autotransporter-associated beta strand protein
MKATSNNQATNTQRILPAMILRVAVVLAVLTGASLAQAGLFVKTNNATALNVAGSWTNNAVPGASDIAQWDSTAATSTTNTLGASMSWSGINIVNPSASVVITTNSGGNTLTLGAGGVNMAEATADLIMSNNVTLPDYTVQTWNVPTGRNLSLQGAFTRTGGSLLTLNNAGTINIAGGTASSTIAYSLINGTDVGSLDASKNVSTVAAVIGYTSVSALNVSSLAQWINFDGTSTATGTTADLSMSTKIGYPVVYLFNTPQPSGRGYWLLDAYKGQFDLNSGANTILVTTNVGACNVIFEETGSGGITMGWRQTPGNSEMIIDQENTAGSIYFQNGLSQKYALAGNILTKRGAGRAIFNTALVHSGPTRIMEGELMLNSTTYSNLSASYVTVNGGATLSGYGNVSGPVTNNGTVWAGTNGLGALALSGGLTLNAGSTLKFYSASVPTTNKTALLLTTNSVTVNGAVSVSIQSGAPAVGQYPLISSTTAFSGTTFANFSLATLPLHSYGYLSNNTANLSIDLVITNVAEPLVWTAGSSTWDFTSSNWKDQMGNVAVYQQNNGVGDSVLFQDAASGTSLITVTLNTNVVPASTTVSNSTKLYTLSGTGTIAGSGSFTKNGVGTLILGTTNTFTGGVYLGGGIVNFSSVTNLGNGGINFTGGTLQYASGNVDDISVRSIWLGPGGGTINDGGNTLTFANPIGNSGTGGFTKAGSSTLTLTGTNKYSGNTVVAGGTLALGSSTTYISNSAAIIVNSGATLDVSAASFVLNGQILAGAGTVSGTVAATNNSTITPATNGVFGTLTFSSDLDINGGASRGATLVMDVATTNSDLIAVGATLNLNAANSATIQINAVNTLTNGSYKLITFGSLNGLANLTLNYSQANKSVSLVQNGSEIDLVITSAGTATVVWAGDGGSEYWDIDGSANWLTNGVTGAYFDNGDKAVFDDTAPSANTTVNLNATVSPSAVVLNVTNNAYTFQDNTGTGAGKISGVGTSVTINGATGNTVIFATANNYGGTTAIKGSTLQVGNGGTIGDLGTGNVTNNGAIVYDRTDTPTVVGRISGTGSLTQEGSGGTLTLAANNTYSGATVINNNSTLQIGTGGTIGSLGTGAVTNDGTLIIDSSAVTTIGGIKTGPNSGGTLYFDSTGTVTLSGGNTYMANTYVNAGTVKIAAAEAVPSNVAGSGSTGWLVLDGGASPAGTFDLNGFNQTVNELSGISGTYLGLITNSAASPTATNTLTVLTGANTPACLIADNANSAKVQLVLLGSSELRLSANNTYSGGTLVGGTATIGVGPNAAIGVGSITLSNATTLLIHNNGGTGAFPGNTVNIPDNSAGIISSTSAGNGYGGSVVGGATATNNIVNAGGDISFSAVSLMQYQNFLGTVYIPSGSVLRFSATSLNNGGSNATFDVEGTLHARNNGSVTLGALQGSGTIDGPTVSGVTTYYIGANNQNSVFSGTIGGVTLPTTNNAIVKNGLGTLTLSGTLSYYGNTTVNSGVLALASSAEPDYSPSITLSATNAVIDVTGRSDTTLNLGSAASQTLSGYGVVNGGLNVNGTSYPSSVIPGTSGMAGTLTVNGNLTLNGCTNVMDFASATTIGNGVNDLIKVTNNLTFTSGSVVVIRPNFLNGGVTLGQPYTLITYGGTLSGDTNNLALDSSVYSHMTYAFSTNTPGAITVTFLSGSNLVWRGDSTNSWQAGVVTNWFDGVSSNNYAQFDTVKFDNTASNFNAVLVGTLMPNGITVNSDSNYVFSGSGNLTGTTSLTKAGTGTLTLSNTVANTFTGSTVVSNGVLNSKNAGALSQYSSLEIKSAGLVQLGGYAATVGGLSGSGAIDNNGAAASVLTVGSLGSGVWSGTISNSGTGGINLVLNGTNNLTVSGVNKFNSATASEINNGTGTMTNTGVITGTGEFWIGSESSATGKVVVAGGSLVVSNWLVIGRGYTNATGTLIVNNGSTVQKTGTNTVNLVVGSLGATGNLTVNGGTVLNNGMLWVGEAPGANAMVNLNGGLLQATQVRTNYNGGAPNSSVVNFNGGILQASSASANFIAVYAANVQNGGLTLDDGGYVLSIAQPLLAAGTGGLIKQGAGTVYLDATNTYTGITIVTNGTLAGIGTIAGPVVVGVSGNLGAGDAGTTVGKLAVNQTLTLHGNATFRISKNSGVKTNDQVIGISTVNYGGTLTVSNITSDATSLAAGDTFTLFNAATHAPGNFTSIVGSPGAGLGYTFTNGVLSVVATVNLNPGAIQTSISGTTMTLSWPTNSGWTLQMQTNSLATGLGTNWVDYVLGTTGITTTNITLDPTKPTVFYRLKY